MPFPSARAGRRSRRGLATVAALVVAGMLLAGCGSRRSEPVYAMIPAWTLAAPAGGASTAGFCRLLSADYGHFHSATRTDMHDVEANYTGFIDAAPVVAGAAPAGVAADARVYLSVTADLFETLLENKIQHRAGPRSLGVELKAQGTAAAMKGFETFVAGACHPDPLA